MCCSLETDGVRRTNEFQPPRGIGLVASVPQLAARRSIQRLQQHAIDLLVFPFDEKVVPWHGNLAPHHQAGTTQHAPVRPTVITVDVENGKAESIF